MPNFGLASPLVLPQLYIISMSGCNNPVGLSCKPRPFMRTNEPLGMKRLTRTISLASNSQGTKFSCRGRRVSMRLFDPPQTCLASWRLCCSLIFSPTQTLTSTRLGYSPVFCNWSIINRPKLRR
ncbi:hypothetical protein K443DRAFT_136270 [Laccaria amethystina LaAM-08-1]|uniref:Uncharacterized protein n=1 Tax=Laccaria amethystina LaAM-08-1 TaxID=1095629 RepID=A0A0C9Y7P3_9AGAR|nr:hypothetical protein K443DRAFT_136270 [Laccaria amethystina LaAM-08-1]